MAINTTKLWYYNSAAQWVLASSVWYWSAGIWNVAKLVWRFDGTNWLIRYSTPTVSCANVSGNASGNAASGLVTSSAAAPSTGGNSSGVFTYFWQFVSGDNSIAISSYNASAPTWSKTVAAGSTSAVWQLNVVDQLSGAVASCQITITLTWTNTTLALAVTGENASGSVTVTNGPISGALVQTGVAGAAGGCIPNGGNGSYTFNWTYVSGDNSITCSNAAIQNPVWSKTMSTAGGATTTTSAVWQISLNDTNSDGPVTTTITITLQAISQNAYPTLAVAGNNAAGEIDIGTFEGTYCTTVPTTTGGCSPSGGNGSYTFNWTYVSGDNSITPNNAHVQNPTWSSYMCVSPGTAPVTTSAVWQVSVTDSAGNGPVTAQISVQLILTADHIYPPLSAVGNNQSGLTELTYWRGTLCENIYTGTAGAAAAPSGGSGIYNYTWSYVSGDNSVTPNATNVQTPQWMANICTNAGTSPTSKSAVWQCSITDSAGFGPVVISITVTLTFQIDND